MGEKKVATRSVGKQAVSTEDRLAELSVLREIVEGTATVIGDDFFRSLVYHLAHALHVKVAFVAEFTEVNTRVRMIAYWNGEKFVENIEYQLAGTPCESVTQGSLCHYPQDVPKLFPTDRGLINLGVESYLGVPLLDADGQVLGHLAVADIDPMPSEPRFMSIFEIFAARARVELERQRAELALRESEHRFARIIASAMDAIITIDEHRKIRIFNEAAEKIFRITAGAAIGQSINRFLTEQFQELITNYINAVREKGERHPCLWAPPGLTALRADKAIFPVEATISQVKVARQSLYTIILRDINERKQTEKELRKLQIENLYLQEELKTEYNFEEIVGASAPIKKVFQKMEQVAATDTTVLIIGETGTGKELFARGIHSRSKRKHRPLIKVNCAALSPGLIESEFFGHEKGAFTGAISQRLGRFELANGGTIFLDEIGDISLETQAKLLRVLQEQEFERVGGSKTLKVDVRVIAATNRDLEKAVIEGRFRADLYYRLNVFPINLPPLRERKDDISLLVRYFVNKHMARIGKRITTINPDTIARLAGYHWPGNIRELENIIERAVILSIPPLLTIDEEQLMVAGNGKSSTKRVLHSMEDVERDYIREVLDQVSWVIEGPQGAARILDLKPNTLRSRMQKLGIKREV